MMKQTRRNLEAGFMNPLTIPVVLLVLLVLVTGGLSIWAYVNYTDQKTNVDGKISVAVSAAKKQQQSDDTKAFLEKEKQPYVKFTGPSQLGSVNFTYPKTWSVYVDKNNPDQSAGDQFEAYLYPGSVPPVSDTTPFALRVSILGQPYDQVLREFTDKVKTGKLRSSPVTLEGQTGVRLDGSFSTTITGAMVIYQIRNQTLEVFTQSPSFLADFNGEILGSLKFNP